MNFAIPPHLYSEIYRVPRQTPEAKPLQIDNIYENETALQDPSPPVSSREQSYYLSRQQQPQQQPQPPPQQQQQQQFRQQSYGQSGYSSEQQFNSPSQEGLISATPSFSAQYAHSEQQQQQEQQQQYFESYAQQQPQYAQSELYSQGYSESRNNSTVSSETRYMSPMDFEPPSASRTPSVHPSYVRLYEIRLKTEYTKDIIVNDSVPRLTPAQIEYDLSLYPPSPNHIFTVNRSTVLPTFNKLPASAEIANTLHLPLGVHFRPFANPAVEQVHFEQYGVDIIRCEHCSAFINPFTMFIENGKKWQCILCRCVNTVKQRQYYCPLNVQTNLREDILQHPELTNCSVDMFATKNYSKSPPRRPIYLMLLDCSFPAVRSGLLRSTCNGALEALEKMKDEELMYMAVVAFDASVYFFNVSPMKSAPEMVAAPDLVNDIGIVNDAFRLDKIELPCEPKDLIVPVKAAYHHFKEIFEKLPNMFAKTTEVDCAFGPALTAAMSLLTEYGGKIITTLATLPNVGEGKLKIRVNNAKEISASKEHTYCLPAIDWYKERGLVCSKTYVSVDIITNCTRDIDLASIAPLARLTSGTIYNASSLDPSDVADEVEHLLTRFMAFESVMRIRSSRGLEVTNVYGHCHVTEKNLMVLAVSSEDATYSFEFKLTPSFKGKFAYVQFAVVYTSRNREKIFRIHTIQFPVVESLGEVINSANSIGVAAFLSKICIDKCSTMSFAEACRETSKKMEISFTNALNEARQQYFTSRAGCLYVPESMKYIPQILSGFYRSTAVGGAFPSGISLDERVAMMARVVTSSPESMLAYYLGWTFEVFEPSTDVNTLPSLTLSSSRFINKDGIVLINLGFAIVLFCGVETHPLVLQTFGLNKLVEDAKRSMAKNKNSSGQNGNPASTLAPEISSDVIPEELIKLRTRVEELILSQKQFNKPAGCVKLEICAEMNKTLENSIIRMTIEDLYEQKLMSYSSILQDLWTKLANNSKKK